MTDSEKDELLVRGIAVAGSDSQWTLLGTSEQDAAAKVQSARGASARLNAWTSSALEGSRSVSVVVAHKIAAEPLAPSKKARQINGVSKALSPEYKAMFSLLSADFISVAGALISSSSKRK